MVDIRGIMTDCPERLTTGVGMIVMLRFYFLPAAFKPLRVTSDDVVITGFNEGQETEAERYNKFSYDRLLKLFSKIVLAANYAIEKTLLSNSLISSVLNHEQGSTQKALMQMRKSKKLRSSA